MKPFINILVLDDDNQFAQTQTENLQRKLKTRFGFEESTYFVDKITQLNQIPKKFSGTTWDIVFCDLGWGDLNLEGIQILNDMKMSKPSVYAVLYTAQDPDDETISQALQWQLNFVDHIIKVDGQTYFEDMLQTVMEVFENKRQQILTKIDPQDLTVKLEKFVDLAAKNQAKELSALIETPIKDGYQLKHLFPECFFLHTHADNLTPEQKDQALIRIVDIMDGLDSMPQEHNISIQGLRLLPQESRSMFSDQVMQELKNVQKIIQPLLAIKKNQELAADIQFSSHDVRFKLKSNPIDQKKKKYSELIVNLKRYPRIENHDLLALDKERFIEFIKDKYGGFPQMAEARGLDLNNIYRVNRKFKNLPFIVFKHETIMEIIGIYEPNELKNSLTSLLASKKLIHKIMAKVS